MDSTVTTALVIVLALAMLKLWWSRRQRSSKKLPPAIERFYSPLWGHYEYFSSSDPKDGRMFVEIEELAMSSSSPMVTLYPGPPLLVPPMYLALGGKECHFVATNGDKHDKFEATIRYMANPLNPTHQRPEAEAKMLRKLFANSWLQPEGLANANDLARSMAYSDQFLEHFAVAIRESADGTCIEDNWTDVGGRLFLSLMLRFMAGVEFRNADGSDNEAERQKYYQLSQDVTSGIRDMMFSLLGVELFPYLQPAAYRRLCAAYDSLRTTCILPAMVRRQAAIRAGHSVPDDALTAMLAAPTRGGDGGPATTTISLATDLDMDNISYDICGFLIAGESMGSTFEWIVTYLAAYPDLQQKCYEDIVGVTGPRPGPDRPNMADLGRMEYWNAFLKEVNRVDPASRGIARTFKKETVIGDYTIPAGSFVLVMTYSNQMSEKNFSEPTKLQPERWLEDPVSGGATEGRKTLSYGPFGHGSHRCFGQRIALTILRTVGACLLLSYRLELVSSLASAQSFSPMLSQRPKKLIVQLSPR